MLTIPLPRLEREGSLEFQAEIPPDDPIWEDAEFRFSAPLEVSGRAEWFTSGEVLVRITLKGRKAQECRRCLAPVEVPLAQELSLLFMPEGEDGVGEEEDGARILPNTARTLDLAVALREELILSHEPYVLCREDCRGLCASCGANLNEETCQCTTEEQDPRWEVLRALKDE